jgi:hypothetical protein
MQPSDWPSMPNQIGGLTEYGSAFVGLELDKASAAVALQVFSILDARRSSTRLFTRVRRDDAPRINRPNDRSPG